MMRTRTERNKTHNAASSGPIAITARIWPGGQPKVSRSPITKGLQENIQASRRIDDPQLSVEPILEALTQLPPLRLA